MIAMRSFFNEIIEEIKEKKPNKQQRKEIEDITQRLQRELDKANLVIRIIDPVILAQWEDKESHPEISELLGINAVSYTHLTLPTKA